MDVIVATGWGGEGETREEWIGSHAHVSTCPAEGWGGGLLL